MNKKELREKVEKWLSLFSEEYDFQYRWYTHGNYVDLIADGTEEYLTLIANRTAYLKQKDDR